MLVFLLFLVITYKRYIELCYIERFYEKFYKINYQVVVSVLSCFEMYSLLKYLSYVIYVVKVEIEMFW